MDNVLEIGEADAAVPLTSDALVDALRAQSQRYHHKHPFHVLMNEGRLSRAQIQGWVANRFYYQKSIPIKDAAILSTTPDPATLHPWTGPSANHDDTAHGRAGSKPRSGLPAPGGLARHELLGT